MHDHRTVTQIGTHSLGFEPPDLYTTVFVGEVSGPEMTARNAEVARFAEGKPFVLGIADVSHAIMTPEARRAATSLTATSCGTAFICKDAKQQLSLSLLGSARSAIHSGEVDSPLGFFTSELDARAWIAERRQALLARTAEGLARTDAHP
jgi:hypothetical protein